jgi:phage tail-like protein
MSNSYPMPAYHFVVDWGGTRTGFSEVSGLNMTHEVVDYREGSSLVDSSKKIPGLTKFENIVLKRGIVKGDNDFFNWMKTKQNSQVERRDISIKLLDETHAPIMVWKVRNAFPVKYTGPHLQARSSEVAIETIEITHEGIEIETA